MRGENKIRLLKDEKWFICVLLEQRREQLLGREIFKKGRKEESRKGKKWLLKVNQEGFFK